VFLEVAIVTHNVAAVAIHFHIQPWPQLCYVDLTQQALVFSNFVRNGSRSA
jgi:hypothetical protein